ncbi:hypothetical protein [Haliangium sp.]|uniref:hypothetical protein n=1 Tax=Haliangium sp. TaxID=2663208 RepID=UPI003D0DBA68
MAAEYEECYPTRTMCDEALQLRKDANPHATFTECRHYASVDSRAVHGRGLARAL